MSLGVHPFRHVQLCLPIVRTPEEFLWTFDLDCVSAFYDGSNVHAADRFVRSMNTMTNFVTLHDLRDRAIVSRIIKYTTRAFKTVIFEVHHPNRNPSFHTYHYRNRSYRIRRSYGRWCVDVWTSLIVLFMKVCKHQPRCDVRVSQEDLQAFNANVTQNRSCFMQSNRRERAEESLARTEIPTIDNMATDYTVSFHRNFIHRFFCSSLLPWSYVIYIMILLYTSYGRLIVHEIENGIDAIFSLFL